MEQAQTSLEDYQAQLEEVTTAYEDAAQVLSNCQYSLNNTDPADDTYGYVYFAQLTTQAQSTADSLEQQKEELEQKVEQAEENVTTAETAYNKAKRELEQGKLRQKNCGRWLTIPHRRLTILRWGIWNRICPISRKPTMRLWKNGTSSAPISMATRYAPDTTV